MVGGQHGGHGAHALEAVAEDHKSGPEHAPTPLQEMVAITAEDQTLKEGDATQRDAPVYLFKMSGFFYDYRIRNKRHLNLKKNLQLE